MEYFNFQTEYATTRRQRALFFERWWRLGRDDPRWTAPLYHPLRRLLVTLDMPHLKRLTCVFLHQEAVRRYGGRGAYDPQAWLDSASVGSAFLGIFTSAAGVLLDPRLEAGRGWLFLPHVINDPGSVAALFGALADTCFELGIRKLTGPLSFSPHLESGLQMDCWHLPPPALAPSSPPYLPELLAQHMQPLEPAAVLWQLLLEDPPPAARSAAPLALEPLELQRLSSDLLPLFAAACEGIPGIPPLDQPEAEYLLARLPPDVCGWLARLAGQPVGFLLIGAEISPALRRWQGGRSPSARLLLHLALRRSFQHGRVYFAGVLPSYRRQGVGTALLQTAARSARQRGWRSLLFGPLPASSPAAAYLAHCGAQPRGEYRLFELEW